MSNKKNKVIVGVNYSFKGLREEKYAKVKWITRQMKMKQVRMWEYDCKNMKWNKSSKPWCEMKVQLLLRCLHFWNDDDYDEDGGGEEFLRSVNPSHCVSLLYCILL